MYPAIQLLEQMFKFMLAIPQKNVRSWSKNAFTFHEFLITTCHTGVEES